MTDHELAERHGLARPTATTDVKGRSFDLGTVTAVKTVGTVKVVELDRWTLDGTSDSTLAKQGVKIAPHKGSLYTNQNTAKTYTAPVAPGARIVVNTCVVDAAGDLGLTSQPLSASAWLPSRTPRRPARQLRRRRGRSPGWTPTRAARADRRLRRAARQPASGTRS